jgi:hypothetical protein
VLGRFEKFEAGIKEYVLGDLVPFAALLFTDSSHEQLVFVLGPADFSLRFNHIQKLEPKEFGSFVEESPAEMIPILISLALGEIYHGFGLLLEKVGVKDNKPDKYPSFVLVPVMGVQVQLLRHFISE